MCIRNESVTNEQIIPHAVLWSNTSDFRLHLRNRGGFLFSNCVDKDGGKIAVSRQMMKTFRFSTMVAFEQKKRSIPDTLGT